jgi:hypothetical protein
MQNLYRHFDFEGALLYVGVSINAINRLSQHKVAAHWFDDISKVEIENYPTREEALKAEREAIIEEKPLHNLKIPKVKPKPLAEKQEERRSEIIRREVSFKLLYKITEAATALSIGPTVLKRLMEENKIGFVQIGTTNHGRWGERPNYRITGWQLIEFIEHLENENEQA